MTNDTRPALLLGGLIAAGLVLASAIAGWSALSFKAYERVVSVKGLSEREVKADVAVWPIRFAAAGNDLPALYAAMEGSTQQVVAFLKAAGFSADEITVAAPLVTDKFAREFGEQNINLRYTGQQAITVYSTRVDLVRSTQDKLAELGKKGIAFGGDEYNQRTQYMFTKLNEIKPAMIAEATQNARAVAMQFATDSDSALGRIRSASQGQFSIEDRDSNTPQLKKVRVVSTVEYYLSD